MNTRFVIPVTAALSLHALALYPFKHDVHANTMVGRFVCTLGPMPIVMPDEVDPPEKTDDEKVTAGGQPDAQRSEEPIEHVNESVFQQPVIVRERTVTMSTVIPTGPIGPGGDSLNFEMGDVVPQSALDNPPRTRSQIAPVYPFEAKKDGQMGQVLVEFTVDESGRVLNPRVVRSSDSVFESPTLRAIAKWRFEPGRRNGRPVRFRMAVPVQFTVND